MPLSKGFKVQRNDEATEELETLLQRLRAGRGVLCDGDRWLARGVHKGRNGVVKQCFGDYEALWMKGGLVLRAFLPL